METTIVFATHNAHTASEIRWNTSAYQEHYGPRRRRNGGGQRVGTWQDKGCSGKGQYHGDKDKVITYAPRHGVLAQGV